MIEFLYPVVFYTFLVLAYLYSKGSLRINGKEKYKKWVDTKGRKVSKAILVLGVIYTILLIIQYLG